MLPYLCVCFNLRLGPAVSIQGMYF
jgi:hypothetical protein